jgi:hypothetical protein
LSRCLPHLPEDGNRSRFRNVVFSSFLNTGRWTQPGNPLTLSVIHHRQNPLGPACNLLVLLFGLEDRHVTFLRNVGELISGHGTSQKMVPFLLLIVFHCSNCMNILFVSRRDVENQNSFFPGACNWCHFLDFYFLLVTRETEGEKKVAPQQGTPS